MDVCRCPGCMDRIRFNVDAECQRTLDYEYEAMQAEYSIEYQDDLESYGSNRFGSKEWQWHHLCELSYLDKNMKDDEIPYIRIIKSSEQEIKQWKCSSKRMIGKSG